MIFSAFMTACVLPSSYTSSSTRRTSCYSGPRPKFGVNSVQMKNPLNLGSRIHIAMDIAAALDYLHNCCIPPLVHCDLKPSNVLLDNDMVAHVSDFGLAKFLYNPSSTVLNISSNKVGVRGSVGYIAPDHGMGSEISTAGDIYSYGIILLEMLTGKHPTDDMFKDGVNLHKLVESAFPENIGEILDPSLIPGYKVDGHPGSSNEGETIVEMQSLVRKLALLGISCSAESPKDRPPIQDIYSELSEIKEAFSTLGC